jgi:hypothetical protein
MLPLFSMCSLSNIISITKNGEMSTKPPLKKPAQGWLSRAKTCVHIALWAALGFRGLLYTAMVNILLGCFLTN